MHRSTAQRLQPLLASGAALVLVVACASGGGSTTWTFVPIQPTPSAAPAASGSPSGSPPASPAASQPAASSSPVAPPPSGSPAASGGTSDTIALEETSSVQITQNGQPVSSLKVAKDHTVTFEVTNTAGFAHNFYIGSPDKLSSNQTAGLSGIPDFTQGTKTLTYTVTADTANLQFACTLPGHYPTMHGTFELVQP